MTETLFSDHYMISYRNIFNFRIAFIYSHKLTIRINKERIIVGPSPELKYGGNVSVGLTRALDLAHSIDNLNFNP